MTKTARLRGPKALYRPKDPRPVTVNLTTEGRALLDRAATNLEVSRADVVEFLLREFSGRLCAASGRLFVEE